MKTPRRDLSSRTLRALALPTALALTASACAPNEVSLLIVQNQVPVSSGQGSGCSATSDTGGASRNVGLLDLALRHSYVMYPLFRNEMRSNSSTDRAETRGFILEGVRVMAVVGDPWRPVADIPDSDLVDLPTDSGGTLKKYTVYSTLFVPAAVSTTPGYASTALEVLPASIGNALAAAHCNPPPTGNSNCPVPVWPTYSDQLTLLLIPFGHTMGGIYLEGARFVFPLSLCCHCLVAFPPASNDDTIPGPDCTGESPNTDTCDPGQDAELDCRSCSAGVAACQPHGYRVNPTMACP